MFIQLLALFIATVLLLSLINQKLVRVALGFIFTLFLILEVLSSYLTGNLIDYRFYEHMNITAVKTYLFLFLPQSVIFILVLIFITWVILYLSKKIKELKIYKRYIVFALLIALFAILSVPKKSIIDQIYRIYKIRTTKTVGFSQALKNLDIDPKTYVKPEQVKATKGKNIIVIALESLERGFLEPPFDNIAPNLRKFTKEWTYYSDMPVSPGSSWTSGSLYAHHVGMPAFISGNPNQFFKNVKKVRLTGLGHILNKAGYNSRYIMGNANTGGMADLLHAYGMHVVSESIGNPIGKYPKCDAGLNDLDLFVEAKLQIDSLKNSKNPFALFMLTINTHFPHGIYDKRMEKYVQKRDNAVEFSVSAVDYLIKDLVDFLKKNNLYKNTSIFIFPDHMFMGTSDPVYNKLEKSTRGIYLLTNADETVLPKKSSQTLYQIQLPKMILAGAGIKTNAKFLADYIKQDNIIDYLEKNTVALTALNNASIVKENFLSGIKVDSNKTTITIKSKTSQITIPIPRNKGVVEVVFNSKMDYQEHRWGLSSSAFKLHHIERDARFLHLIISLTPLNKIETLYLGDKKSIGLYKKKLSFSANEIKLITQANQTDLKDQRLIANFNAQTNRYIHDPKRYIARSGGLIDKYKNTNSLEALNYNYSIGFRNFELNFLKTADNHYVAVNSWEEWKKAIDDNTTIPPSLEIFKSKKIYNKYTPLSLKDVNSWFKTHKDAKIFVNDIQNVKEFSEQFIDKARLTMQLNSIKTILEATNLNIQVLPSVKTFMEMNSTLEQSITQVKVRPQITYLHKNRAEYFLKHKIKMFTYDLESNPGKSINYVLCHKSERKYFYGMFVHTWDFNKTLDCSKYNRDISNPYGTYWDR